MQVGIASVINGLLEILTRLQLSFDLVLDMLVNRGMHLDHHSIALQNQPMVNSEFSHRIGLYAQQHRSTNVDCCTS